MEQAQQEKVYMERLPLVAMQIRSVWSVFRDTYRFTS